MSRSSYLLRRGDEGSARPFQHGAHLARCRDRPAGDGADDGGRALGLPQKTTGLPDTPTESAPARPGSPVRFATALSTSTSPHPHLRATTQSPVATLP